MACHLLATKPPTEPMVTYCQSGPSGRNFKEIYIKISWFPFIKKINLKMSSANCQPFCSNLNVFKDAVITFSCQLNPDPSLVNSSPPGQNGRHFADDIFRCIFVNENFYILIWISLKFVPKDPINSIPALIQIMAWRPAIIWTNDG